jgi:hypothetical protein
MPFKKQNFLIRVDKSPLPQIKLAIECSPKHKKPNHAEDASKLDVRAGLAEPEDCDEAGRKNEEIKNDISANLESPNKTF